MKEKMIYSKVRRDVQKGTTPAHKCKSVNSKNALNILTAVNIKGGGVPPVYSKVLDTVKTNASVFIHFVRLLLVSKVLVRGDIFIVDNCTVHLKGDNIGIQEELFQNHGILMITLPPYHPDFNPTDLVFALIVRRLSCDRARYNSLATEDFTKAVEIELDNFDLNDVVAFYRKCGYYY